MIEDSIAPVKKSMQGRKLGLRVIQVLTAISEGAGCYKTILNCSDDNTYLGSAKVGKT